MADADTAVISVCLVSDKLLHHGGRRDFKISLQKQGHVPEGVFGLSERLLGKHHDGTGVDREGQPVVQVHVLQPVVVHLREHKHMSLH